MTCDGSWTQRSSTSVDSNGYNDTTYYWQVWQSTPVAPRMPIGTWWSFTTETGIFHILLPLVQK
jgi:hypothetical protein